MGYDVARAIAVIGMVIVNYHNIFLVGRTRHPHWFTGLAFFLQGRAAAIFVGLWCTSRKHFPKKTVNRLEASCGFCSQSAFIETFLIVGHFRLFSFCLGR